MRAVRVSRALRVLHESRRLTERMQISSSIVRPRIVRLAAAVALGVFVASCAGSDGGADSDPDEFCAALTDLDEMALEDDPTPFVEGMKELNDAAPDEISDATAQLVTFIERSAAIGELEGAERDEAIQELAADEGDFDQAVAEMQAFASDACPGLGDALFGPSPDE